MYTVEFQKESLMPRERLMVMGAEQLSNQELLSIVLRTGTKSESVTKIAQEIVEDLESLADLRQLSLQELQQIKGIGPVKSIELKAMLELARRVQKAEKLKKSRIVSSNLLAEKMIEELKDAKQEHVVILYLDTQNRIIEQRTLFIGSVRRSVVEAREILHYACKNMATSLIMVHNHPSGATEPSTHDISFTKKLKRSCDDMGIIFLDHLIVGKGTYYSFREESQLLA